jgi:ABC-2 type transport system ATP-binding protein
MIEVAGVSKWFGDVVAVSDVSFEVGEGVTAMLGPNGAGKSTLLRLICGLISPSRGEVKVLGTAPRGKVALYRQIGLVPEQDGLLERLSGMEFVNLAAKLHNVPQPKRAARRSLDSVGLDPDDRRVVRTYSKGMRQRLKMAQALVHDPRLLILDEPLNGLDPRQRVEMIGLFRRLGEEGRCVLVSSHVLDEVARMGSRVLVLAKGRLVAEGDYHGIRELLDERPHRLRVSSADTRRLGAALIESGVVVGAHLEGGAMVVETTDVAAFSHTIAGTAKSLGVRLYEVAPIDDDLETVFRYLLASRR